MAPSGSPAGRRVRRAASQVASTSAQPRARNREASICSLRMAIALASNRSRVASVSVNRECHCVPCPVPAPVSQPMMYVLVARRQRRVVAERGAGIAAEEGTRIGDADERAEQPQLDRRQHDERRPQPAAQRAVAERYALAVVVDVPDGGGASAHQVQHAGVETIEIAGGEHAERRRREIDEVVARDALAEPGDPAIPGGELPMGIGPSDQVAAGSQRLVVRLGKRSCR